MITFNQVTYTYPAGTQPALQNINLNILEGEFTLLVGPSGAGKSTLLRCINGLVPHFSGGNLRGNITVNGLDPVRATPRLLSRQVGFVFQDPEAQFVMERVEDEIAFALENAAMPPQEMRIRVEEVLDLLDLAPLRRRPLETLSGGEQQRVAIASALAFRPGVLVLDEPTSQLDPKSAEDVLQALVRLNSDLGLTILLAEHRLERVLPFIDRIIYLPAGGDDLLAGDPRQVLNRSALKPPLVALGQALKWDPLPLTIKEGRAFSRGWLQGKNIRPGPVALPSRSGRPYLEAKCLVIEYEGRPIVRDVDLELWPGEVLVLMGRNGAGKTTLLKSLVGLVRLRRGQIKVAGQDIARREVADVCRQVGYLPQDPNALLFADTVLEEVEITLCNHGLVAKQGALDNLSIEPRALLAKVGLADKLRAYPRDLSAGERQRVALAAITVTQPGALLLDEPTRGLDYLAKRNLIDLLRDWRAEGLTILLVTHDVEFAAAIADRVALMSQGEIIATGSPGDVLASSPLFAPQIARLFPNTGWLTVEDVLNGPG